MRDGKTKKTGRSRNESRNVEANKNLCRHAIRKFSKINYNTLHKCK